MRKFWLGSCFVMMLFFVTGAFAEEPGSSSDPLITKSYLENRYGWQITTLLKGENIGLDLGSEAVLRSGKAIVLGTKGGGLADLTLGQDLPDQTFVIANHYLVCPSSDGRGIKALTTSVFLTRGAVR